MTTAVIVAAGAGARLGEIGRRHSKPMVPLLGRVLIDWVIERLAAAGCDRIIVVAHPENEALQGHLATNHRAIAVTHQAERRGMADAVARALPLLDDASYLACACDSLFPAADIARLIADGQAHAGAAVLGVLEMGIAATSSRSAVVVGDERVIDIREKPAPGTVTTGLVGMPLYWLPRSVDAYLQPAPGARGERQVAEALRDFIADGGTLLPSWVAERLEITCPEDIATVEARLHQDPR